MNIFGTFLLVFMMNLAITSFQDEKCFESGQECYCTDVCSLNGDCCNKIMIEKHNMSNALCYNDYYVIMKCFHVTTGDFLREQCETIIPMNATELILHVPVYGMYQGVYHVYKNVFCALCNGRETFEFANVSQRRPPRRIPFDSYIFEIPERYKRRCYNPNSETHSLISNKPVSDDCSQVPLCIPKNKYEKEICHSCNSVNPKAWNASLIAEGIPVEITAIDYNKWCLKDCQERLQRLKNNSVTSLNHTSSKPIKKFYRGSFHKILFMTLRALSMFCLILLLIVFSCIDGNRNRARSITVFLVLSLIILNLVNVIISSLKTRSNILCFFLSIPYHFSFLSAYFWTTLFAVDVYQSLTSSQLVHNENVSIWNSKKLKIYLLIGYGGPLILVLSAALIQWIDENNIFSAGFGEIDCLINRTIGGLVWFFIPLCISLVIDVILCICLYKFLYVMSQQTVLVRLSLKARKQNFLLCLKLSLLMGFVCLPAFLGVFIDNNTLKYFGAILSSLQGAIVSLCFILGARTRGKTYQYLRRITKVMSLSTNRKSTERQEL